MPSLVVDSSALVDLFTGSPVAGALYERLFRSRPDLHAPHSIDVEFAHAISKLSRRELLRVQDVEEIAAIYGELRIERHAIAPLMPRIWQLRFNISSYDAAYVALAESLGVPLVTRDAALAHAPTHTARIEYIA